MTQFAIGSPAGGRWRIEVEDGSSPVTSVRSANGLDRPNVSARVTGTGNRRAIAYRVAQRAGQKVTFVERGPSGGTVIGTARRRAGKLRFRPGAGEAEGRQIVAIVEQDGQVRDELPVASYRSPGPQRPGRVRGLRVRRQGGSVVARWRPAHGADRHDVRLRLSDGRRLSFRTRRPRLVVRGIGRAVEGRLSVRGNVSQGVPGRAARRTI